MRKIIVSAQLYFLVLIAWGSLTLWNVWQKKSFSGFLPYYSPVLEDNLVVGKKVCLFSMNQADLEQVPGISPVVATLIGNEKISLYSTKKSKHLSDLETLMRIKGIGKKKAATILHSVKMCD